MKTDLRLPCEKRLEHGSFLSTIYPSQRARRRGCGGVHVRVEEYRLEGVEGGGAAVPPGDERAGAGAVAGR